MFQCQNESCLHSFKAMPHHSNEHDGLVITCPKCSALHVTVEKTYEPSGVANYRFKIRPQKK